MYRTLIYFLLASFVFASCDNDEALRDYEQNEQDKVKEINDLLQYNTWSFYDLLINVKTEMRAIPLMANIADENGMVQPGKYSSFDIFGNTTRQDYYSYQFLNRTIYTDTLNQDAYNKTAKYLVLQADKIGISPDSSALVSYDYEYIEDDGIFKMTSGQLGNAKINETANNIITKAIYSGKPNDIANNVVERILANEEIQATIQELLYDLIHGKIDQITENPEEIAQELAVLVLDKLKTVDWETLVYNKLVEILEQLKVDDPEKAAEELATKLADKIETSLSQQAIYDAILPILINFEDETLPKLVPNIADAIYALILQTFSEENIAAKIYPLWINFSEVDSSSVSSIADTLGSVISHHFLNQEELALKLEPFVATLQSTSIAMIPSLAQEIIDDVLIPLVDSINVYFPGLELDPDWNSVKPILTSALTVIKTTMGDQTVSEASNALAESIISIMERVISQGIESVIFELQTIPAEQASEVIAAWINNMVVMAEPKIIEKLETKLNELIALFNAEEIAEELSTLIHNKITEVFSSENIYNLILPAMEQLSELNVEAIAETIADWLTDLEIIKDNVSEEQILSILSGIIEELIGNVNVDEASQKLTDAILESDLVNNIDGAILKQLLEIKTYELLLTIGRDLNAIDEIEISLIRK